MTTERDAIIVWLTILIIGAIMGIMGYYEVAFVIFIILAMCVPFAVMRGK